MVEENPRGSSCWGSSECFHGFRNGLGWKDLGAHPGTPSIARGAPRFVLPWDFAGWEPVAEGAELSARSGEELLRPGGSGGVGTALDEDPVPFPNSVPVPNPFSRLGWAGWGSSSFTPGLSPPPSQQSFPEPGFAFQPPLDSQREQGPRDSPGTSLGPSGVEDPPARLSRSSGTKKKRIFWALKALSTFYPNSVAG